MRRQVIIVTHNANLVVNTDSDQIIIARASPKPSHDLPRLTYDAGGLGTLQFGRLFVTFSRVEKWLFRNVLDVWGYSYTSAIGFCGL